ncbi:hypothetical protein DYH09_12945, partial [bacterium CPR1]|nr:hypothetical protein [bacterium CPR1]
MVILTGKLATPPPSEPRLRFTSYELRRLRHIASDPKSAPSHVTAAKSVLRGAQGETSEQTAFALDVPVDMVRDFQRRFAKCRFDGLGDLADSSMVPAAPSPATGSAVHIRLTGTERRRLERIARAHTSEQRMVLRAQIVLLAHFGRNNCEIADELAV